MTLKHMITERFKLKEWSPCIYEPWFMTKIQSAGERIAFDSGLTGNPYRKKNIFDPYLSIYKNQFRWTIDLNVKNKTVRLQIDYT